jgi:hypothetical protein
MRGSLSSDSATSHGRSFSISPAEDQGVCRAAHQRLLTPTREQAEFLKR